MSLLDMYNETKKSFNPAKDKVNSNYSQIPAGKYLVTLENVNHFVSQRTGFEQLSLKMVVVDGQYASRIELVGINLADTKTDGSPMNEFVVRKNLKLLMKISSLIGLHITDEMLTGNLTDIYEKLKDEFSKYLGKMMEMTITESPNKKDPSNPYRNYEFDEAPKQGDPIDISDDDLPF